MTWAYKPTVSSLLEGADAVLDTAAHAASDPGWRESETNIVQTLAVARQLVNQAQDLLSAREAMS